MFDVGSSQAMMSSSRDVVDVGSRMRTPTVHPLAHQDDSSAFSIVDVRSLAHQRRGQSRRRAQRHRRHAPTSPQSPGPAISNDETFNFTRSVGTLTNEHGPIRLCRQCYQCRFCRRHSRRPTIEAPSETGDNANDAAELPVPVIAPTLVGAFRHFTEELPSQFPTEFIPLRPEYQLPPTRRWDDAFLAILNANILNFVPYAGHGELSSAWERLAQVLTARQLELLVAYRQRQGLRVAGIDDNNPLFRMELVIPPTRRWHRLPHAAAQYVPGNSGLQVMQHDPANQRQEIVGGYIGEVQFPQGQPTLPDYVHLIGPDTIYPPIPSASTDIFAGAYAPGTTEDDTVWQYNVGHPLHRCARCNIDH